jgi:hypothetical protein
MKAAAQRCGRLAGAAASVLTLAALGGLGACSTTRLEAPAAAAPPPAATAAPEPAPESDVPAQEPPPAPAPAPQPASPPVEAPPAAVSPTACACSQPAPNPHPKHRHKPKKRAKETEPQTVGPVPPPPATAVNAHVGQIDGPLTSILGKNVYSPKGEDLGRVVDLLADPQGRVRVAIVDFGGFLGVGTRRIAVDWPLLHFSPGDKDKPLILTVTREKLQSAPEYKEAASPRVLMPPAAPPDAAGAGTTK